MVPVENPVLNGAQLLKKLVETGTGAQKLTPASNLLEFVYRKEKRIATANEVIDVLEQAGVTDIYSGWPRTPDLTVMKARALAATGQWNGTVEVAEVPVWDALLAGQPLPDPEEDKTVVEQAAVEFDPGRPGFLPDEHKMERTLELKPAPRRTVRRAPVLAPAPAPAPAAPTPATV